MSPTLLEQGVEIMLFGMGTVIVFLTLLVLAMVVMSRLLQRFYPAESQLPLPVRAPAPPQLEADQLLAVITAAVHRHRQQAGHTNEREATHG